ncbi:MAG TPA: hypothetical protein VLA27_05155 [Paracoccaceae bacterium]|nr:hypothetical protein [Paracoccaceae bacterium]
MTKISSPKTGAKAGESREDRLKAALKANMARRKAQARARAASGEDIEMKAGAEEAPQGGKE